MDEHKQKEQVRHSVDARLSGLQGDPWLAQRILANAKGEVKMKKKLSVGLILAIVLVLVAVTALAVSLLSSKAFVEQVMKPSAMESTSEYWTTEEIDKIMELAQENGIEINNDIRKQVASTNGTSKEELMRAFAKLELSPQPAAWSIEDQAWYDELLVACGLRKERTRFLPSSNEITEQEALSIATQFIITTMDSQADLEDSLVYTRYVQYMLSEDKDGSKIKVWDIEYESANDVNSSFYIIVSSNGTVVKDESYMRTPEIVSELTPVEIQSIEELAIQIDQNDFFSVENMAHFAERYGKIIRNADGMTGTRYSALRGLLEIPYSEPRECDINESTALSLANNAIRSYGWADSWLSHYKYTISYRVYDETSPIWRVCFKIDGNSNENYALFHNGEMPFGIVVYLDAQSGTLQRIVQLDEMDKFDYYCEFPDEHDNSQYPSNGVG